jgi:hypothetical protein
VSGVGFKLTNAKTTQKRHGDAANDGIPAERTEG